MNFYQEGDVTHFNQELASCHIQRVWDELVEKSRYEERREHIEAFNRLVLFQRCYFKVQTDVSQEPDSIGMPLTLLYSYNVFAQKPFSLGYCCKRCTVFTIGNCKPLATFLCRENRWKKRGIALTPTKFGISFTALFMNQVRPYLKHFISGGDKWVLLYVITSSVSLLRLKHNIGRKRCPIWGNVSALVLKVTKRE